ncbi:hypothetical protein ACS0TY_013279 [Phlomoides rotata]
MASVAAEQGGALWYISDWKSVVAAWRDINFSMVDSVISALKQNPRHALHRIGPCNGYAETVGFWLEVKWLVLGWTKCNQGDCYNVIGAALGIAAGTVWKMYH